MHLKRRRLLPLLASLMGRGAGAGDVDVARGCSAVPPFGLADVDAAFPGPRSGERPLVACFYYTSWYPDPGRMQALGLPTNFSEWDRVKQAKPVIPCEVQPKVPAWGDFNAADPRMSEREIAAAADAGINVFVFNWSYGAGRSVGMAPINRGFLRAPNRDAIQFALMWINNRDPQISLDYDTFDWSDLAEALLRYAMQPNYWKLDGKPVFGIYKYAAMHEHYGAQRLKACIGVLRWAAQQAGYPGLFVFCCADYKSAEDPGTSGFDAVTAYNAMSVAEFGINPRTTIIPYREAASQTIAVWNKYASFQTVPFVPSCPVGWDNSARTRQVVRMVVHRSADQYEALIVAAKRFVWRQPHGPGVVFLSSWNEWAEDHYLLPDEAYGDSYLKAVKKGFA